MYNTSTGQTEDPGRSWPKAMSAVGIAGAAALLSDTQGSVQTRIDTLHKRIEELSGDVFVLTDRLRPVRRLSLSEDGYSVKSEPEEYTSELSRMLAEMASKVAHISRIVIETTNELEV